MDHTKDIHTHTHTHTTYSSSDIPIFTKLYEFYNHLSLAVNSFPKTKRYTRGQKLDNIALDIFELLFEVPLSNNKSPVLQQISVKVDLLKVLLRCSKDNQSITDKRYLELQIILQEIGKMLGGWIRSTKQNY